MLRAGGNCLPPQSYALIGGVFSRKRRAFSGLTQGHSRAGGAVRTPAAAMYHLRSDNRSTTPTWGFIMTSTGVNNGVNVQALLDAREALKGAPEATKFTWRASCKWQNGTHSESKVKSFFGLGQEQKHKTETSLDADHPEIFASEDRAITPIEYVLVGLASCLTAGVAAVAQNRGIQLRSVESKLEGKMDIRGILGMDSDVRNGYDDIKVTFKIDADASKEDIEAMVAQSQKRSAVYDVITQSRERHRRNRLVAGGTIEQVTTVVIGAGHAGLAASRCLSERSIDHVVLERGEVANSWRRERWDSLRLLTPNWQSRLPGYHYDGADPDGYMTMREVIDFISRFAVVSSAPVRTHTTVTRVQRTDAGYHVATSNGRSALPRPRDRERRVQPSERAGAAPGRAVIDPVLHPVQLPQSERLAGRRRAGRRRVSHRRPARRRDPPFRPPGHASPSASTSGCRGRIAAATCSGGWRSRACGTSATTRVDDLMRSAASPRRSSLARPSGRRSISTRSVPPASRLSGVSPRCATDGPVLRRTAKSVCAGRLEDEPAAGHVR